MEEKYEKNAIASIILIAMMATVSATYVVISLDSVGKSIKSIAAIVAFIVMFISMALVCALVE